MGAILKKNESDIAFLVQYFTDYCDEKHYHYDITEVANAKKIAISNLSETTILVIYYKSSSIVVQGKKNSLRDEFIELKNQIPIANSQEENLSTNTENQRTMKYHILHSTLQNQIRQSIESVEGEISTLESKSTTVDYHIKIIKHGNAVAVTQYKNGTLLLQGKNDLLFSDCCDIIEKTATPSQNEIISRFVPDEIILPLTDESIEEAEENLSTKIGDVYNYLEPHDRNWFISSEFLCSLNLPLPEYSPLVMPASKAFEGFCKKIVVDLGLYEANHFKKKGASFSRLKETTNGNRKTVCEGHKYGDTMLKILDVGLDEYRNFMMHSDDEEITKVKSKEDAVKLVNSIVSDTKKVFDYFNRDSDLL